MGERMRQEYQPPESLSEDEVSLRQTKAAVELYSEAVANASRRAEKLLREFETLGMVVGDLGLSLIRLGKYEDEEGSRCGAYTSLGSSARAIATDARRLGMAAVRVSRLARSATGESVSALEPLHTELALAPAVIEALQEREAALLTLQSIKEDMSRKQAAVEALESAAETSNGDLQKITKVQHLKNEVAALEAAAEVAQIEYDRVKSRNVEELKRYNAERAGEFRRMATAYSRVANIFESRESEVWRGTAEDLGVPQTGVETLEAL
jgi:sorting nexin-1/2